MRRKDKEIRDAKDIEKIIRESLVCRIGMCDGEMPYIVPVCFGYKDKVIYFHSAKEGKKIEVLKENNRVCFEFDTNVELLTSENPCKWSMRYRSVIGFGRAYFVEDEEEKKQALEIIMRNYSPSDGSYNFERMGKILVVKIIIDSMTGKQSGFGG